jgi:hypothetical protein
LLAGVSLLALPMIGCQKQDEDTAKKLGEIDKRLARIETAIKSGRVGAPGAARGRNARRRPQRPPGPNPNTVYSVPLGDSATIGPKHAKVTVVEAFEFA